MIKIFNKINQNSEAKSSIARSYFSILIIFTFLIVLIFGGLAILEQYSNYKKEIQQLKEEFIEQQKEIAKNEVEEALDYLEWRKETCSIPDKEMQKEVLEWFSKIRFQNRGNEEGILFVRSFEGYLLMSISTPDLIGKDISMMTDPDSINTHDLFINTIKNPNGGFAEYSWYNPATEKIGKKISFVKEIPAWDCYIGAGFWIDDINYVLENKYKEMRLTVRYYVLIFILSMLLLLLAIYINLSFLSKKMSSSFIAFSKFFSEAENKSAKIDINKIEFSEFKNLANSANQMIEKRELADKALRESEDRWQFALESSGDGLWDWNTETDEVFYSKRWKEMLGYEEHEISNTISEWDKLLHLDDKEKSRLKLNKLLSNEIDFLNIEHRLLCKDNTYKWILGRGKVVSRTADNKPLRVIGTHIDLTSQKQASEELMIEKEFSEKIIETSSAVIVGLDKDHLIRIFNKGAETISGYKKEEVLGKDWFEIFFPSEILDEMNKVWKDSWGLKSHTYENPIKSKSGKEKIISFQTTGIYEGEDIDKHLMISIGEDITDKKEIESQLELSRLHYTEIFENAPISLWEEDFTDSMNYLEEQLKSYNLPIEELLDKHPDVVSKCLELVKILDVNNYSLKLYKAKSKNDLLINLNKVFTEDSFKTFKLSIIALYNGESNFIEDGLNKTLEGDEIDVHLQWSFLRDANTSNVRVIVSAVDLTELHVIEHELQASENRFRSIFENNHSVMLLIDPENGRFIDANPAAVKFYGYNYREFTEELSIHDINESSKKIVQSRIEKTKNNKQAFFNFKHKLSNGDIRDVEVHTGSILIENKPVLFSIVHDATEKEKAKFELEQSKNKLESIFRAAPTGIGVVSNRIITEVNQRFCDMMGYKEEELLGEESIILYPSKKEFEWVGKEKYEQIKEKGTGTVETTLKHKDGHVIDVLLSSTPMDLNDLSIGVTFTALDITQRKKDVDELEKHRSHLEEIVKERTVELEGSQDALLNLVDDLNLQSKELANANKKLANINQELETFTYSVSHDLKAPLRGIDGYSQLLLSSLGKNLDSESNEFLTNIRKSSKQMNVLIEDLLAYSRMERKDFQSENINFGSLINELLLHFAESIKANNVKIKLSVPKNLHVKADKNGLNLIMRNLIDNAIKFTSDEKSAQIEISCVENTDNWHILVKDNGIGFDMKYHDRIYKIFQRLHLAEEYEGTGIGLAMVSKAVQRMNGKIWAESISTKGASFYIEFKK